MDLTGGQALFTQPPMPTKCAGAPRKALHSSADHRRGEGRLGAIEIAYHTTGPSPFWVRDDVPALAAYVDLYGARLCTHSNLVAIHGPGRVATFDVTQRDRPRRRVGRAFDMIHVCQPQAPPDVVRVLPLADAAGGWTSTRRRCGTRGSRTSGRRATR